MGERELREDINNPFLDNSAALKEARADLKMKRYSAEWFHFLIGWYERIGLGKCDWAMWDDGEPDMETRIRLLEKALVLGKKIPKKYFTVDNSGLIY